MYQQLVNFSGGKQGKGLLFSTLVTFWSRSFFTLETTLWTVGGLMASLAHAHKYTHAHSHTPVVTTFRYCQVSLGGQCKAQLRNTGLKNRRQGPWFIGSVKTSLTRWLLSKDRKKWGQASYKYLEEECSQQRMASAGAVRWEGWRCE